MLCLCAIFFFHLILGRLFHNSPMHERLIVLLVKTPDHSLPEDLLWLQEGRKGNPYNLYSFTFMEAGEEERQAEVNQK